MNSRSARYALIALGWTSILVGLVGIVVPGLPTTVFLLIAAWAFSRSSERFQTWLITHPRFGPPVVAWRENGAIPLRAKLLAVGMMTASLLWIVYFAAESWHLPVAVGTVMAVAALYVVTRPNA